MKARKPAVEIRRIPDLFPGRLTRWLRIKPLEIQSASVDLPIPKSRTASAVRTNSGMIPSQRPGATGATVSCAPSVSGGVSWCFMDTHLALLFSHVVPAKCPRFSGCACSLSPCYYSKEDFSLSFRSAPRLLRVEQWLPIFQMFTRHVPCLHVGHSLKQTPRSKVVQHSHRRLDRALRPNGILARDSSLFRAINDLTHPHATGSVRA